MVSHFEHQFWLQILTDHLQFIMEHLAESEEKYLDEVHELKKKGHSLLRSMNESKIIDFVELVMSLKTEILELRVNDQIKLSMSPTIISHMLNEAQEYLELLIPARANEVKRLSLELATHKLWLTDIIGHLDAIKSQLDGVEKDLKKKAMKQQKGFSNLQKKTLEFIHYLKHGVKDFPAIDYLTETTITETNVYLLFLKELFTLKSENMILGHLSPLFIDHMFREQSYYLIKLGHKLPEKYALEGISALPNLR